MGSSSLLLWQLACNSTSRVREWDWRVLSIPLTTGWQCQAGRTTASCRRSGIGLGLRDMDVASSTWHVFRVSCVASYTMGLTTLRDRGKRPRVEYVQYVFTNTFGSARILCLPA